ncbi:MAG: D-alanyl-D-alanine carboxypeptidase/D-alanyl-D-alanine endopeptidase [Armatimonadota bacterium]
MRHRIVALLVTLVLVSPGLLSGPARAQPSTAPVELASRLDAILSDSRLAGTQVSVTVRDAPTGEILYAHNADARLVPASNQKLIIAAAAFAVLGSEYRFRTTVLTSGRVQNGVLEGNLYLKGTGDPTMLASRYADLARALAARGIRSVRGRLIADDTWFDDVRLGPDWSWDDEAFAYAAQVSALTVAPDEDFDAGTVIVDVHPGIADGAPARVILTPATRYLKVINRVRTGVAGSRATLTVDREHGANTVVLAGSIPVGTDRIRRWVSVWEPTAYAAEVFLGALAEHGVRVDGRTTIGSTPLLATELAAIESMPLGQLAVPFLKLSNNGIAEILIKAMGRRVVDEGSWRAGLQVVADYLVRGGVNLRDIRLRDGSGLSRLNLVTTRELTRLLADVQREPWFGYFYDALPIAGVSERLIGGTLRSRMSGTRAQANLRAKTGSLTGVSALSGFVAAAGRNRFVFSSLINNFTGPPPRDIEDAIGIMLAGL